jgi:hypothetical protein
MTTRQSDPLKTLAWLCIALMAVILGLVALLIWYGAATPAAAQTADCTVTPSPLPYGSLYTLTLTSATPGAYYVARLSEAGLPGVYDPLLQGEADPAGMVTVASGDWTYLQPGLVRVKWYLLDSNFNYQGGAVACQASVEVTP